MALHVFRKLLPKPQVSCVSGTAADFFALTHRHVAQQYADVHESTIVWAEKKAAIGENADVHESDVHAHIFCGKWE